MPMLLVVDMQPRFDSSTHDWLLENVAREIRAARSAKWGIMFLEYTRKCGKAGVPLSERTHGRLTRLVARYRYAITVHKKQDNGSAEVLYAADEWYGDGYVEHIHGGIRVVGVNMEACIAVTVNGLSKARSDVEITVVGDACNGVSGGESPSNAGQDKIVTDGRNVRVLKVA